MLLNLQTSNILHKTLSLQRLLILDYPPSSSSIVSLLELSIIPSGALLKSFSVNLILRKLMSILMVSIPFPLSLLPPSFASYLFPFLLSLLPPSFPFFFLPFLPLSFPSFPFPLFPFLLFPSPSSLSSSFPSLSYLPFPLLSLSSLSLYLCPFPVAVPFPPPFFLNSTPS